MHDGVCADPEMFGALLKLGVSPTVKMKNNNLMGDLAVAGMFSPPVLIAMIF